MRKLTIEHVGDFRYVVLYSIHDETKRRIDVQVNPNDQEPYVTCARLWYQEESNRAKIMVCSHCGKPIELDRPSGCYIHTERTGSSDITAEDYDNGYWCNNKPMTTSATPR